VTNVTIALGIAFTLGVTIGMLVSPMAAVLWRVGCGG
jgi:hypothetical protein